MSKSLLISVNSDPKIGIYFRDKPKIKPNRGESWNDYYSLEKPVELKKDLKWTEVKYLQNMLCKGDIWHNFPAVGLTLVSSEFSPGDEKQRLDLLYLREDGGLLPCELKIGGNSKDTHGQLIRYMADLSFQKLNQAYIKKQAEKFHRKIMDHVARGIHENKFNRFCKDNKITDKAIRLIPRAGILIDEKFNPSLLKAVRFLNNECGFSIRMLKLSAFVAQDWNSGWNDFIMRLDFTDIQ
jgi:hypothetical protein